MIIAVVYVILENRSKLLLRIVTTLSFVKYPYIIEIVTYVGLATKWNTENYFYRGSFIVVRLKVSIFVRISARLVIFHLRFDMSGHSLILLISFT